MSLLGSYILFGITLILLAPIVFYLYVLHREYVLRACRGNLAGHPISQNEEEPSGHVRVNLQPRNSEYTSLKLVGNGLKLRSFSVNYYLDFGAVYEIVITRSWISVRLTIRAGEDNVEIDGYYVYDIITLIGSARGIDFSEALESDYSPFSTRILSLGSV